MNKWQSVAYIPGMPIYRDVEVLQEIWNKVVIQEKNVNRIPKGMFVLEVVAKLSSSVVNAHLLSDRDLFCQMGKLKFGFRVNALDTRK